jgi:glucose-6-phosphate 1-dehydrogenase
VTSAGMTVTDRVDAGKCMPVTSTEIRVRFRRPPHNLFGLEPFGSVNSMGFRVWPGTRTTLTLVGRRPGLGMLSEQRELMFAEAPVPTCGRTTG